MKQVLFLMGAALLLAASAHAGSMELIKKRAQGLSDQNNARQADIAPSQAAPPAQPTPPQPAPTPPATPTAEQQSMSRFQAGLAAIKSDETVAEDKKQQLAKDLLGAAQGSTKPPAEAVKQLVEDLCAAFAQKPLEAATCARLIREIDAILNPAKYPKAQKQAIFDDLQAMFQTRGLTHKDATKIVEDVKALAVQG